MSHSYSLLLSQMGEEIKKWKKEFIELLKPPKITIRNELIRVLEYVNENNKIHRDALIGPAYVYYYKTGQIYWGIYYNDGKRHRLPEDGPAWIHYRTNGQPQLVSDSIVDGKLISFKFY